MLALVLSTALPTMALADGDWRDTFEPHAVASYLDVDAAAVMVIGAGELDGDLEGAALALEQALRDSGDTRLVMDAKAIGRIADLGDSEIVQRTMAFPIDRVVLIRVFTGEEGEAATAVVTFYDKSGEATSAFTAMEGTELERASGVERSTSSGVSKDAVDAVSEILGEEVQEAEDAVERYEKEFLWYQEYIGVSSQSGAVVTDWSKLYQGKYKKEVSGGEFYEIIGRDDLLEDYRLRQKKRGLFNLVGWGGGAPILFLGIILTAQGAGAPDPTMPNFYDRGEASLDQTKLGGGIALMVVGGAIMGVFPSIGLSIAPHPVDAIETRELVDDYNKQLRRELGLPENVSELSRPTSPSLDLELAVSFAPGAFTLSGRF